MPCAIPVILAGAVSVGCGTDPADVALLERGNVEDVVAKGMPLEKAIGALVSLGYSCHDQDDSGAVCSMTTEPGSVDCAVAMRVKLKVANQKVEYVDVNGGERCL
jgi:hypothetical protein